MAITRALMRAAQWSEAHHSEAAQQMMRILNTHQNEVTLGDWQAAMEVLAFVPMAESARPILVGQFDRYLTYGMAVEQPIDAAALVDRIYSPLADEIGFAADFAAAGIWSFVCRPAGSA
jgi:hypothetical protein